MVAMGLLPRPDWRGTQNPMSYIERRPTLVRDWINPFAPFVVAMGLILTAVIVATVVVLAGWALAL